ncbi:hypothetical protein [Sinorhizobium meliloti]|uniref:hypothetical protein n=1 Tax=Rhizobium meliloti TaxID=382 RepID=UPI000FD82B6F|nr:hypothetical protein [Sinorhizobium meliloti]RVO21728.1 hypothetical protein CN095_34100 [Sinorhizobium meliloti]
MLELPKIGEATTGDLGAKPHYEPGLYCEHPGFIRWGSFDFAVGRAEANWFCSEHQPEWKPARSPQRHWPRARRSE